MNHTENDVLTNSQEQQQQQQQKSHLVVQDNELSIQPITNHVKSKKKLKSKKQQNSLQNFQEITINTNGVCTNLKALQVDDCQTSKSKSKQNTSSTSTSTSNLRNSSNLNGAAEFVDFTNANMNDDALNQYDNYNVDKDNHQDSLVLNGYHRIDDEKIEIENFTNNSSNKFLKTNSNDLIETISTPKLPPLTLSLSKTTTTTTTAVSLDSKNKNKSKSNKNKNKHKQHQLQQQQQQHCQKNGVSNVSKMVQEIVDGCMQGAITTDPILSISSTTTTTTARTRTKSTTTTTTQHNGFHTNAENANEVVDAINKIQVSNSIEILGEKVANFALAQAKNVVSKKGNTIATTTTTTTAECNGHLDSMTPKTHTHTKSTVNHSTTASGLKANEQSSLLTLVRNNKSKSEYNTSNINNSNGESNSRTVEKTNLKVVAKPSTILKEMTVIVAETDQKEQQAQSKAQPSQPSQSKQSFSSSPAKNDEISNVIISEPIIDLSQVKIEYKEYASELQMHDIMRLIQAELSEPYSIYTYRYFIYNWPNLCFLAAHGDEYVGTIVCKLDMHMNVRRGYIAMLAVRKEYRKLKIGTTLVQKAIEAMLADNADEVVLETEMRNLPALRLYENLGFVRDKRLFRYYLNGVDALRLKLWFR